MGGGSWSSNSYVDYAKNSGLIDNDKIKGKSVDAIYTSITEDYASVGVMKSAHEIFKAEQIDKDLNPMGLKVRESRDSVEHPASNAILLGLDVTGSMGIIAQVMAQNGLPMLMKEIYERKPVTDPQVAFMGIDDIECGGHIQLSQFESDVRIAEQLHQLWLEGGGGGNYYESYSMAWLIAARHTAIDCWEKRQKKGYLFTVGDEEPTPVLHPQQIEHILGYTPQGELTGEKLLEEAQKTFHVYHVLVEEGSHMRGHKSEVTQSWKELLGEHNTISLADHTLLAETVVSTIQIAEGGDADVVASSWTNKKTATTVKKAVQKVKRVVEL